MDHGKSNLDLADLILIFYSPQLRDTLTVIIHNAWTLDFNKALSSFELHVKGTRNLIDLARQSPNSSGVRFLFTSSIASAQSWVQTLGPLPKELQYDASVALGNGYGESKYVSERVCIAIFSLRTCANPLLDCRGVRP
jgi:nucleoside-diphosphate-sugar epimerase